MELRLVGTVAETQGALRLLAEVFELRSVSPWLRNRGSTALGRVYVDIAPRRTASAGRGGV